MVSPIPLLASLAVFARGTTAQISSISASPVPKDSSSTGQSSQNTTATSTTSSTSTASTTAEDLTVVAGGATLSNNATLSATTSARPQASNTTPCNGYTEFCDRRFSNVSMVVAHNSPFVRQNNAASNQVYPVLTQLDNGIRGLSFETQKPNSTSAIRLCHTSCNILDVGTLESYLATVRGWLADHPYEVITIMMGNNNGQDSRISVTDYIAPFQDSGILQYLWTPPSSTLSLSEWPTLAEMIIKNKRVVVMLDYGTDQNTVPWLLSAFNYYWETPFSPTDPAFPCTQQRPPNQAEGISRERMYLMNHNLNIEITLLGKGGILVPAYGLLDQVNADSGNGSVGLNAKQCEDTWGRPPNWILVDYYNFGNFNGSVFKVAAEANGVGYDRRSCCGSGVTTASRATGSKSRDVFAMSLFVVVAYFLL
ncbi:hypothetical protein IAQ61_009991 [Plenodomus lingam]|uniref:uncharacterized protein n=1 Tax=Leptosphaeria maculans TaxID=5022 RepID=UPI00331C6E24|nr:hypothetical protein IAQ61_009991 [Plenodomus lingam]